MCSEELFPVVSFMVKLTPYERLVCKAFPVVAAVNTGPSMAVDCTQPLNIVKLNIKIIIFFIYTNHLRVVLLNIHIQLKGDEVLITDHFDQFYYKNE